MYIEHIANTEHVYITDIIYTYYIQHANRETRRLVRLPRARPQKKRKRKKREKKETGKRDDWYSCPEGVRSCAVTIVLRRVEEHVRQRLHL
jgi:hypothetical protein